jgi:hypothetical protein
VFGLASFVALPGTAGAAAPASVLAAANGGEAYIRPDLDGCDPSFVVVGRVVASMFGGDPLCAGDAPAPAGHPVDVGGAQPGVAFPLTVAVSGPRLYALVDDRRYASSRGVYLASPGGTATLRCTGQLVFTVAGTTVVLRRIGGAARSSAVVAKRSRAA